MIFSQMNHGQWSVVSSQWPMVSGNSQWSVVSCYYSIVNSRILVVSVQSLLVSDL